MNMQNAYRLAAAAVRQRYLEQRPQTLAALDSLRKQDVAVLKGTYDSVENVLDALGLAYVMSPKTLTPKKAGRKVVFANCASAYAPTLVSDCEAAVRGGALLVSSDWALSRLIAPGFPGTIARGQGSSRDEVVGIEPTLGSLWSEVVVLGADPQWWLEGGSEPIAVLDPDNVSIEAESHELLCKYGASPVAASFGWHAGRVFHVVSHFWLKRTRTSTQGSARDFLVRGMKLSPEGIEAVFAKAKVAPDAIDFASLQSAATSTELIARLLAETAVVA